MSFRHHVAAAALAFTSISVGCGGGSKIELVHEGKTTTIDAKSGTMSTLTATKTLQDKTVLRAAHARLHVGNYDGNLARTAPSKEGEARVYFTLTGASGTDHTKDPLPTGSYKAGFDWEKAASGFRVEVFEGGKAVTTELRRNLTGTVEVTKSSVDAIEGTIDVKSDDGSLKGPFSVKLPPKK
jgi:hypothetical protein